MDNVAPNDEMEEIREPDVVGWVLSAFAHSIFSSYCGVMWFVVRMMISDSQPHFSTGQVFLLYGVCLFCWVVALCWTCLITISQAVLLFKQRLPEVALKKIKATLDNIGVSAASSCCSLFLCAICLWRLDEVISKLVRTLEVEDDDLNVNDCIWFPAFYSTGFFTFLGVALFCSRHTIRLIRSRKTIRRILPTSDSDDKKLPSL